MRQGVQRAYPLQLGKSRPVVAAGQSSWSTLRLLRTFRNLLLCLALALLLCVVRVVHQERADLREVGQQEAPALLASFHLRNSLQAMEAASLTQWLEGSASTPDARQAYEEQRSASVRNLLHASAGGHSSPGAEASLESIALGLGTYERLIGRSQELQRVSLPDARTAYVAATRLMEQTLLPAADLLEDAEHSRLRDLRSAEQGHWLQLRGLTYAPLVLGTFALLLAQLFLSRRTRRLFNLPLLGATALMLLSGILLIKAANDAHEHLQFLRDNALASSEELWQMREAAYAAEIAEGEALWNAPHSRAEEARFNDESAKIASGTGGLTPGQLRAALRESGRVEGFSGLFAAEIGRPDSASEREALLQALETWQHYSQQHVELVRLKQAGQNGAALQLFTGEGKSGMSGTLVAFNRELAAVTARRQGEIEEALAQGTSSMDHAEPELVTALLALGGLVLLGFAPRIREYL